MVARKHIGDELKLAAIQLYERKLLPLDDILDCVNFSARTFYRTLRLYRTTGHVSKPNSHLAGRPRKMNMDDVQYLLELVHHHPDWFLDELVDLMDNNRFISVYYTTIHRELERHGLSTKKLRIIAAERNQALRADFVRRMAAFSADQLVFLDETSKDERTKTRRMGRSKKGRRALKKAVFVRGQRLTGTGALSLRGMEAVTVCKGSMTRVRFLEFLEGAVLPICTPFPGPRSVLVMDNARIHHGERILELAEEFGVRIVFLPPYSPDLNPIEEAFSKIKHFIRRNAALFMSSNGLLYSMHQAMDIITADDAEGYIMHAGYM